VPAAVRWPAGIKPGSRATRIALTMDIFATALDAAGLKPQPDTDGVSFLPALRGEPQAEAKRDLYFIRREGGAAYGGKTIEALRRGDWKLLQDSPFAPLELYNVATDPKETTDLAGKEKKVFRELSAALRVQVQRGGGVPWQPPTKR
jgi:arylsulfatase A-like enzyme